jgi:hypothetical protein
MDHILEEYQGPEWSKCIKAAIIVYREEVLPFIKSGLEENEEYAFEIAAVVLRNAKFALTEGIKDFSVISGNTVIFYSKFMISQFDLLTEYLLNKNSIADDKDRQAQGIKFVIEQIENRINFIEIGVDSLLIKK